MIFTSIAKAKKETKLTYLGKVSASSKMMKNEKVSKQYTYAIYLAPATESGYNVCPNSTPECRLGCLSTSGRAGIDILGGDGRIKRARIKKSKLFFEQQDYFMNWVVAEMKMYQQKAIKDGFGFSARLNATSDIDWENVKLNGKNIFEIFPDVQFYDYSKQYSKLLHNIPNYQLTFSYTGRNKNKSIDLLLKGNNIAVVFDIKKGDKLPNTWNGFKVIDGDITDYRVNDENGVVVGLHWKRIANKQNEAKILNSVFVVKKTDIECTY